MAEPAIVGHTVTDSTHMRISCVALSALVLGACAHVHVDADGTTRILGLAYVEIPPVGADGAGQSVRTTSVGVSLLRTELATGIAVGYHSHASTVQGSNTCRPLERHATSAYEVKP